MSYTCWLCNMCIFLGSTPLYASLQASGTTHTYIHACIHACMHPCIHTSILRSEISELRNSTTPSKTSEESRLQMENKDLKQRLQDLEMRHDALKQEAKALQDENKSLITALRLLNSEIEKENKHSNLHTEESLGDPVQQDSEWNQVTSKKRKRQGKKLRLLRLHRSFLQIITNFS